MLALLDFVRAEGLPEPYYLLAHSMGGCIGLRSLQGPLPVRAAVFTAPMWGIQMTASLRSIAWSLSTVSRRLGFGGMMAPGQAPHPYVLRVPFEDNTLTSDQAMWRRLGAQISAHPELALGGPTLTWLNEALVEMRTLTRSESPRLPTQCWLGTDEAIVDPGRVHEPDGSLAGRPAGTVAGLPPRGADGERAGADPRPRRRRGLVSGPPLTALTAGAARPRRAGR